MQEVVKIKASEQIKRFQDFIESYYYTQIVENLRKDNKFVVVDFTELSKFDIDLANSILEKPEDTIKAAELAVEQFDLEDIKGFKVRFINLPENQRKKLVELRSEHLDNFIKVVGEISGKSDVFPKAESTKYECPVCGNIINVLQLGDALKEPSKCGCGRKGRFILLSTELIDIQELNISDPAETLDEGDQPLTKVVLLKDDLTSPNLNKTLYIYGSRIVINGIYKKIPLILRTGAKSTKYITLIEANSVEPETEESKQFNPTPKEEKKFMEISKDPETYNKLIEAIEPTIHGEERAKEAILLQAAGGVRRFLREGDKERVRRGDVHIFLMGDPATGKSILINFATTLLPRGRLASGKGISGPGLCAAVVKNEIVGGNRADAGLLVLAHKSIAGIDEIGDIDSEQLDYLNPAMEQQKFRLNKAGVDVTFNTQTRIIAGANPKFGRFDPYKTIIDQFDIDVTLLTRFDLLFPFKDIPDKPTDKKLAKHILFLNAGLKTYDKTENIFFDTNKLRKYIQCALKYEPELTPELIDTIGKYYVDTRNPENFQGEVKVISLTARQLEGLLRLSEASAKLRFSKKAEKIDAERAIDLMQYSLTKVGYDEETGTVDIDKIATGISATERNAIGKLQEIIKEMENTSGKSIDITDLVELAKDKGISEERTEEIITKILKKGGDFFEPKSGTLMRVS